MLGILGGLSGGLKMALLGAVVAAGGLLFWYVSDLKADRDKALGQLAAYTVALEEQKTTIQAQQKAIGEWSTALAQVQVVMNQMVEQQKEASEQTRKLNDVLSKHDLDRLAIAKPGLIENRINRGTADILRMFEAATGGGGNNSSGDSEAKSTEAPASRAN